MTSRKQFAVIGLGRFGRSVCRTLARLGHEVLGIEENDELLRAAQDEDIATHLIQADATNIHALREAGVQEVETVIVAIGTDLEASVLVVMNVLELGVKSVVAKAAYRRYGQVLERVGGDAIRVVYPEEQMGERVAHGLGGVGVMESIDLDPDTSIVEVPAPSALLGRSLAEAQVRQRYGVTVIAILRDGKVNSAPTGLDRVHRGDILALIGPNDKLLALQRA